MSVVFHKYIYIIVHREVHNREVWVSPGIKRKIKIWEKLTEKKT